MSDDTKSNSADMALHTTLTFKAAQQLVTSVMSDYNDWKSARSQLEKTWQECWEAYLCDLKSMYVQPDDRQHYRSQITRPVLYEAVESIHAFLMNTILPPDEKFFSVRSSYPGDEKRTPIIEALLQEKLQQCGFYEKYALFLKQAIITGNTVACVPWIKKTRKYRKNKPINILGVMVGREKHDSEIVLHEGPDFEVIDIFDFLVDPNEPDYERAKVIRRMERPLQSLLQSGLYQNLETLTADTHPDNSHKQAKRHAFGIEASSLDQAEARKQQVTLYEAWGDFIVDGTVYENYVCVIANGERLIRFEPNPYDCGMKPFIFSTFIPVPNEVYGIGSIEKSLGLQHAINTLTNQKLDIINISINNPFTYLINDDVFDPDTLVTRPGALIPVKSHDTLRPIQYLNNFTVAFNEIDDLKNEINQATGVFKLLSGEGVQNSTRTATEISALISGGQQKFSSFTKHLENTSLEPTLQLFFELSKQFASRPEILRLVSESQEEQFVDILPEVLEESECRFQIVGSEATWLKNQELNALLEFTRLMQSDTTLQSQVDKIALYKKIYRHLGFRDEEQIFISPANSLVDTILQENTEE